MGSITLKLLPTTLEPTALLNANTIPFANPWSKCVQVTTPSGQPSCLSFSGQTTPPLTSPLATLPFTWLIALNPSYPLILCSPPSLCQTSVTLCLLLTS